MKFRKDKCVSPKSNYPGDVQRHDHFILLDLGDPFVLRTELREWNSDKGLFYTMTGIVHDKIKEPELTTFVTSLVNHGVEWGLEGFAVLLSLFLFFYRICWVSQETLS